MANVDRTHERPKTPLAMRLEALALLTLTQVAGTVCFRQIAGWMMRPARPDALPPHVLARQVSDAIAFAVRHHPWRCLCLPQAMAGKLMLARRGFSSTIHLGVTRASGSLSAHAWLDAGAIVTGADEREGVARFQLQPADSPKASATRL